MPQVVMPTASRTQLLRQWRDISLIAGFALCSGFAALASLPGAVAGPPAPLAAIFPPWISGDEAVARTLATGARILRQGAVPFVVVLAPEIAEAPAARPSGAILMLRLDGLAGCIIAPQIEANRP